MKRYTLTAAQSFTHSPEHPERTACRPAGKGVMDFDVLYQVWPNRESLLKTLEMQSRTVPSRHHWRAVRKGA